MSTDDIPLIDGGSSPEFFASGLHDVQIMGPVCRFVMFAIRSAHDGTLYKDVPFTCIMPLEAVAPAIVLTLKRLPSGIIVPAVGTVARHLLLN